MERRGVHGPVSQLRALRLLTSLAPKRKKHASKRKTRARSKTPNSILPAKIFGVPLSKGFPLFRQVVQRENGGYRADRNTSAAIDALHRVDVQHLLFGKRWRVLFRMDTIHRAGVHTSGVLSADARFCNYVCHKVCVSLSVRGPYRTANSNKNAAGGTAFCRFSTPPLTLAPRWAHTRRYGRPRR